MARAALKKLLCLASTLVVTLAVLIGAPSAVNAQQSTSIVPNFWDKHERFNRPDLSTIQRLKFLTTTDFPPFNFIDRNKRLTGFNVELARAICAELDILASCQIQAVPWDELDKMLIEGDGDALIAGVAINEESRALYDFTRPYLQIPARFVVRNDTTISEPMFKGIAGKNVGIVAGSAHAAFYKSAFVNRTYTTFPTRAEALLGLRNKQVDAIFGDALSLSFWLASERAENCCQFVGGPFLSEKYFGYGMSIALPRGNRALVNGLNYALREINDKGLFAELYLRYFPVSLY